MIDDHVLTLTQVTGYTVQYTQILFNTTYTFKSIIRFNLFEFIPILNILKCVRLIEYTIIMHHLSKCTLTYNLWDHCADTGSWIRRQMRTYEGKYGYLPIFSLMANNQHCLTAIYYWTCKNEHIATKYAIMFNTKRLLHDIFHIGPGISPRLPY